MNKKVNEMNSYVLFLIFWYILLSWDESLTRGESCFQPSSQCRRASERLSPLNAAATREKTAAATDVEKYLKHSENHLRKFNGQTGDKHLLIIFDSYFEERIIS